MGAKIAPNSQKYSTRSRRHSSRERPMMKGTIKLRPSLMPKSRPRKIAVSIRPSSAANQGFVIDLSSPFSVECDDGAQHMVFLWISRQTEHLMNMPCRFAVRDDAVGVQALLQHEPCRQSEARQVRAYALHHILRQGF